MKTLFQQMTKWVGLALAIPTHLVGAIICFFWSKPPPKIIGSPPDLVPPQYLNVDGIGRVAFWKVEATAPKRTALPMLYLTGGPSAGIGKFEALSFSRRYPDFDIYFLDQISVGASDRLARPAITLNNSVAAIHQSSIKIIGKPSIVVGGSWGAALSARFAIAHPQQVKALLLLAPAELPEACRENGNQIPNDCYSNTLPKINASIEPYPIERLAVPNGAGAKTISPTQPTYIPDGRFHFVRDRLWLANITSRLSPSLAQIIVPLNERYLWEVNGMNTQVNVLLRDKHLTTPIRASESAANIPTLILRGDLDFISINQIGGYQILFPNSRFIELKNETHEINEERCAPIMEARKFLSTHAGSPTPTSCSNQLVPIREIEGGYTLNVNLTF